MTRASSSALKRATPLKYYRALFRKIIRLPLDTGSLERLRAKARDSFTSSKEAPTYSVVDRIAYDRATAIMDDILSRKYKSFHHLLDLVYKPASPSEPWIREFQHTKYSAFKKVWPHVHLIHEFGDSNSKALYDKQLQLSQPQNSLSLMRELALEEPTNVLSPLPRETASGTKSLQMLRDKYAKFHSFISQHASLLSGRKIPPMEVLFQPNRYGLPESVTIRESKLKKKVTTAKALLEEFKPIKESDLRRLISVVESQRDINPNFFRSSIRQKVKEDVVVSPLIRKYIQHKVLVPNERNIKFYYRQYVENQFFLNSMGDYEMSPRQNFYK